MEVNTVRETLLYQEVGKLTRMLHNALVNFQIDQATENTKASRIVDASNRLNFVIQTTENAANKTMDMVEQTIPISEELGETAKRLKVEWQKLIKRELSLGEFRELYKEIDGFLDFASSKADNIGSNLNNIVLAQDYQDITGQVIKKVIALVHEVEDNLVSLVKMAANLETYTSGDIEGFDELAPAYVEDELEGPVINKDERSDVVKNQDEVDDLLSSLGF